MDYRTYQSQRHALEPATRANLVALSAWAEQDALPWLWSELATIISKNKASPSKACDAIRQGCRTSFGDHERLPNKSNFYVAQLTMLDCELRRYCNAVSNLNVHPAWFAEDAKIDMLHGAIHRFLAYAIILLDQGSFFLLKTPRYGAWAKSVECHFQIYKGAEQVIYGRYSGMTHDDHAPYVGIAILRTAIEVRLRDAFGIKGLIHQDGKNFKPIDLSRLFDAINRHKSKIKFAVDFDDTVKIYRWSNFYLHNGQHDYPWVPGFALQYLRPMISGVVSLPNTSWSINNGIKMPRQVWRDIRAEFDPTPIKQRGLTTEIWNAVRSTIKRQSNTANWTLIPAHEDGAACTFLD